MPSYHLSDYVSSSILRNTECQEARYSADMDREQCLQNMYNINHDLTTISDMLSLSLTCSGDSEVS